VAEVPATVELRIKRLLDRRGLGDGEDQSFGSGYLARLPGAERLAARCNPIKRARRVSRRMAPASTIVKKLQV
jgi:hypothetical protein